MKSPNWNTGRTILIIILALATLFLFIEKCNQRKTNLTVSDVNHPVQKIIVRSLNDSLKLIEQDLIIAETKREMKYLQSTLQAELIKKTQIQKVISSIEYKDRIVYVNVPGERTDYDSPDTLWFPLKFRNHNKFLDLKYKVFSRDSSMIDSLSIFNKTHLVIGEKGKWYQKKTIIVGLVNENPYYIVDSLQSTIYVPKEKLQVSLGWSVLANQKSVSTGPTITLKKGIFSFSAGYKLF